MAVRPDSPQTELSNQEICCDLAVELTMPNMIVTYRPGVPMDETVVHLVESDLTSD